MLAGVVGDSLKERGDGDDGGGAKTLDHRKHHGGGAGADADDARAELSQAFEIGEAGHEAFVDGDGEDDEVIGS